MDLVDYQESVFNKLAQDFLKFSENLQFKSVEIIPISAINGDNIVKPSEQMDWYKGLTVLEYLEAIHLKADKNNIDARFPVQTVIRASGTERLYGGMVAAGKFSVGDEIIILPSGEKSKIISLETPNSDFSTRYHKQAKPGDVVNLRLSDQRDISRGDMIARPNNRPEVLSEFEAMLIWFDEEDLRLNREYVLRHTTKETKGVVGKLHYALDINTLHKKTVTGLKINEIGRCSIELARPIYADSYDKCRDTGSFILVDSLSNKTVAAGLIINRISESDRRELKINDKQYQS
jgi:sulfate adenylyltransferase subunit 1 (EFTu-like GTPase family)